MLLEVVVMHACMLWWEEVVVMAIVIVILKKKSMFKVLRAVPYGRLYMRGVVYVWVS